MAPQPMTPEQRNALRAQFARMFDPAARRAPVRLAPPPVGEADAFINPAAPPPPGEADAFISPPAAPLIPPAAPINIGAPMLPPARPQLSGFLPYRGDAAGSAGVGAIEQGYQRDLAAQVPVRKVTIGAPPPPAPATLPGPDSRLPGSGPQPSDIVTMADKQTTVQGVSGIKVPPEVESAARGRRTRPSFRPPRTRSLQRASRPWRSSAHRPRLRTRIGRSSVPSRSKPRSSGRK
jgi:hypothetical protein